MASDALQCRLPVAETFAKDYLEYYRMLPLELTAGGLTVAIHGTPNDDALMDLKEVYGVPLQLEEVDPTILTTAIRQTFARTESVVEFVRDLQGDDSGQPVSPEASILDVRDLANQAPVIRYANLLLREAHQAEASDIHVESSASGMRVRFRRDGVLVDVAAPPPELQAALVSRLKLLAELDIAQKRVPQDGRFRMRVETRELDIRVSCVPTHTGESIVLRLLDRGGRPVSLDQLGLAPEPLRRFHHLARRPHGILLATGPTGCGKTTTLYAALGLRNASAEKVITVEDPVEYELSGVTQIPVRANHGVTFASALRSILRQDPDVLFIGEMRDPETAAIAIQAAMTGHLVFSTLHTNDAPSALVRLLDLGIERYLLAATVDGILAQRLIRRVCPSCRVECRLDQSTIAQFGIGGPGPLPSSIYRGAGCPNCFGTGFKGRTGIFELLELTDDIRHALASGMPHDRVKALAHEGGNMTLKQDGWSKVIAGVTTPEEVLRVVGEC